jgi:hypothetical protein
VIQKESYTNNDELVIHVGDYCRRLLIVQLWLRFGVVEVSVPVLDRVSTKCLGECWIILI